MTKDVQTSYSDDMHRRLPVKRRKRPGEVRDAILAVLAAKASGASVTDIERGVEGLIGSPAASSIRSYLRLNSKTLFRRRGRGVYALRGARRAEPEERLAAAELLATTSATQAAPFVFGRSQLFLGDCFNWLKAAPANSIQAVVTDPPYGLLEYRDEQQKKLREGRGGVWRIPPSFDGAKRSPLPRFTILSSAEIQELDQFFFQWAQLLKRVLVPGANVVVASNPLLSYVVSGSIARAGFERRGEIVRLVMTMRGGDRPKAAHEEFSGVSVMPRSMWEPWVVFRKPLEGRAQDNLRKWGTGGFRRPSGERPFGDVIESSPTQPSERELAPHPSLKPQSFMRTLVRGVLPLGTGIVLDPFAGAGSTLAAAEAAGYASIGVERDPHYFEMAQRAIPRLVEFKNGGNYSLNL